MACISLIVETAILFCSNWMLFENEYNLPTIEIISQAQQHILGTRTPNNNNQKIYFSKKQRKRIKSNEKHFEQKVNKKRNKKEEQKGKKLKM